MSRHKLIPEKKIGPYGQYQYGFIDESGNRIIYPIFLNGIVFCYS